MKEQLHLLIEILLDKSGRWDERDDAAIDLGGYSQDKVVSALISVAIDPSEKDSCILDVVGESIAKIWIKKNLFDLSVYKKMLPEARGSLFLYVKSLKPEWIKKYNLE